MSKRKFKDGEKVHFKKDKLIYNGTVVSYDKASKKPYLVRAGTISFTKKYAVYKLRVKDLRKGYYNTRY